MEMSLLAALDGNRLTRFVYWAISITVVFTILLACCWVILRWVERREREKERDKEEP